MKQYSAIPSSTMPAAFLIHTIHTPALGSAASVPENSPTTTSSAVIPRENTKRYTKPSTALRVLATQVSTAEGRSAARSRHDAGGGAEQEDGGIRSPREARHPLQQASRRR